MIRKIKTLCYNKLVAPILQSETSVHQTSLATAIGVFVGLLPIVGIQMYVVAVIWGFCRYLLRIHFNLPVAVALVWITNPITVVPVYYVFLVTGIYLMSIFGSDFNAINYNVFKQQLIEITNSEGIIHGALEGFRFLLVDLGVPIIIGSLVYAIPFTIVSYIGVYYGLQSYRKKGASSS